LLAFNCVQDSLLELTRPSRAILSWDDPVFEIDLKVKAKGMSSSSEDDKILCLYFFGYNNICYKDRLSYTKTKVVSSKHSTVEARRPSASTAPTPSRLRSIEAASIQSVHHRPGLRSLTPALQPSSTLANVDRLGTSVREVTVAAESDLWLVLPHLARGSQLPRRQFASRASANMALHGRGEATAGAVSRFVLHRSRIDPSEYGGSVPPPAAAARRAAAAEHNDPDEEPVCKKSG
jgi:hypothetical protein